MAVEARRGCGYRKKGGIYLVSDALSAPCDRMPYKLDVCPCCGAGIKVARGWTWIDPIKLFGEHQRCADQNVCPMCHPETVFGAYQIKDNLVMGGETTVPARRAGLLFVGDKFYTPDEFLIEAERLGVSRRVSTLPRGFKVGQTWVFLAHSKAWYEWSVDSVDVYGQFGELEQSPAIFCAFKPKRIEFIVDQSELDVYTKGQESGVDPIEVLDDTDYQTYLKLQRAVDRGMTLVPVPDNDPDHH